jgi:hypothetical protein
MLLNTHTTAVEGVDKQIRTVKQDFLRDNQWNSKQTEYPILGET